jgi:hypothetical protein
MKQFTTARVLMLLSIIFFITLIFSIPLNNVSVALFIVFSFLRKEFWNNIKSIFKQNSFLIFGFYVITILLGLIFTSNIHYGVKVLERNASFLIFPIIIAGNRDLITKTIIAQVLNIYTIIILVVLFISLINCYFVADIPLSIEMFYRDHLRKFTEMQPMYLALYVSFAGIWAINVAIEKYFEKKWLLFTCWISITGFSLLVNILLATRMTIIALIIALFIVIILKSKKVLIGAGFILLFIILAILAFNFSPILKSRYTEISETALQPPHGIYYNSVNLRVAHWLCSVDLIQSNYLLGVGIGDVQDCLNECYQSKGWSPVLYKDNYNAHCQFLQTFIGLGIVGLISLILLLVHPIVMSLRMNNFTSVGFFILIFVSAVTESLFLSQKGIVFFAFFAALFTTLNDNTKANKG